MSRMKFLPVFALAVLLAGCSDEPGAEDIRAAVMKAIDMEELSVVLSASTDRPYPSADHRALKQDLKTATVEKIRCERANDAAPSYAKDAPGYACDYLIGIRMGDGTVDYGDCSRKLPMKVRFFKIGDEWTTPLDALGC